MALVVEDGTGLTTANSYASVLEVDAYFTERGNAAWNGAASKDTLLIAATDYLDATYGPKFKGLALTSTQSLQFPKDVFTGIPVQLKRACFELALLAVSGSLFAPNVTAEEALLKAKSVTVGPVTTNKEFFGRKTSSDTPVYSKVEALLKPLLKTVSSVVIR